MGLLFDAGGNRYIVTHTSKRGRRYRYYVVTTNRDQQPFQLARLPAHEIEPLVFARIRELLNSPEELLNACQRTGQADLRQVTAATQNKLLWLKSKPHKESAEFLRAIVKRVVIKTDEITIEIDVLAFLNTLGEGKSNTAGTRATQQNGAIMQLLFFSFRGKRLLELSLEISGRKSAKLPYYVRL